MHNLNKWGRTLIINKAYLGLGTNLGERIENLKHAVKLLDADQEVKVIKVSPLYETDPIGGPVQGPFLNACAEIRTFLSPVELLTRMLSIEDELGRVREKRWGPRLIDLDLLVYGEQVIDTEFLQLPHPRMEERNFVMVPLNDIAPDLIIPGLEQSVRIILSKRNIGSDIKLYAPAGWHTR